jgi:hypothetical protein
MFSFTNWFFRWKLLIERAFLVRKRFYVSVYRVPFHLVTPSVWPLVVSLAILLFIINFACGIHRFVDTAIGIKFSFIFLLWSTGRWWQDIVYEGFIQGCHTAGVRRGLRVGIALFIFSEVMFFAAFFWAFFHSSLTPVCEIGGGWPPVRGAFRSIYEIEAVAFSGSTLFNPWLIPLLNTLLLLGSGAWLTYGHAIMQWRRQRGVSRRYLAVWRFLVRRAPALRGHTLKKDAVLPSKRTFFHRLRLMFLYVFFVPYLTILLLRRIVYEVGTLYFSNRRR